MGIILRYIGRGDWIFGVPARDLTARDFAERELDAEALVRSGLYVEAEEDAVAEVVEAAPCVDCEK